MSLSKDKSPSFQTALLSGAMAGLSVDLALFPLDTIKTRLQSEKSFLKSGGLRGIYSGIGSVSVGSMPGAALFFTTYELVKACANPHAKQSQLTAVHMVAASTGEIAACLVRVPTEVVKSRAQATSNSKSVNIFTQTVKSEGFRGLYRGYFSTVMREIPFSLIQFPLWEYLKHKWAEKSNGKLYAWQSSLCGAFSGTVAAAVTTPLDVAKTRIMLAEANTSVASGSITHALNVVYKEKGIKGLYAGVIPRVMWISIGGAIFLGIYDKTKSVLMNIS